MKIKKGSKVIEVNPVKKLSLFGKFKGLMFSRRKKAKALLFEWKNCAIHSFFVFYPFLALWLDGHNKIVDKKIVKPFSLCVFSGKNSEKLLEVPINKKYRGEILSLVGEKTFKKNKD